MNRRSLLFRRALALAILTMLIVPAVPARVIAESDAGRWGGPLLPCASADCMAWTNENDGAGSGLDADLLDGFTSQDFLDAIAAATLEWVNLNTTLRGLIGAEAVARMGEDAVLQASLAGLGVRLDSESVGIRALIGDEAAARLAGDATLTSALGAEMAARLAESAALRQDITSEADARMLEDALIHELIAREVALLREALAAEAQARTDALAAEAATRQAAVSAITVDLQTELTDLRDAIAEEADLRRSGDTAGADALAAEIAERQLRISGLSDTLNQEIASREAATAALQGAIAAEAVARLAVQSALLEALATEVEARNAAISALSSHINAETIERMAGDSFVESVVMANYDILNGEITSVEADVAALQTALAAETAARTAALTALTGRVASLEGYVNGGNFRATSVELSEKWRMQSTPDQVQLTWTPEVGSPATPMVTLAPRAPNGFGVDMSLPLNGRINAYDGIFTNRVGIGTSTPDPTYALDVNGHMRGTQVTAGAFTATGASTFYAPSTFHGATTFNQASTFHGVGAFTNRLGLGTATPDANYRLDVYGKVRSTDDIHITGDMHSGLYVGSTNSWGFQVSNIGGPHVDVVGFGQQGQARHFRVLDSATGQTRMAVDFATGSVGIRKAPDATYELDVNGDIRGDRLYSTMGMDITGTSILRSRAELKNTLEVTGKAGFGRAPGIFQVEVEGDIMATGHIYAHSGAHVGDIAEPVTGLDLAPGDVVMMDGFTPEGKLRVKKADHAFSKEVVGVVSTNPSLTLAGLATDTPLAVTGIVPVKVMGVVARGDLLTTSAVPGVAVACHDATACYGVTFGKALESFSGVGVGSLRALVAIS